MVQECLDAGWVELGGECCLGKGYRATERLVWGMENYAMRHMEMAEETNHEAIGAMVAYRKLRQPLDVEQDWNGLHLGKEVEQMAKRYGKMTEFQKAKQEAREIWGYTRVRLPVPSVSIMKNTT